MRSAVVERKRLGLASSVILFVGILTLTWAAGAAAERKTLAEKLLEILKANGQITEEQYNELMKEAQAEKAAQAEAAGRVEAQAARPAEEKKPLEFDASWKNGLNLQSGDQNFKMHLGGMTQVDFANISADNQMKALGAKAGQQIEGYGDEFRRVRLTAEGTIYNNVEFKSEFDFARASVLITDTWLGLKEIPYLGHVRVGHMKEPFSLEELTGDNFVTFMERALPNAFAGGGVGVGDRNMGVEIFNSELNDRMVWYVGGFLQQNDAGGDSFGNFSKTNVVARVTGLPWYEEEGRKLLHLGLGYGHRFRSAENPGVQFQSRPEVHTIGLNTVNTLSLAADGVDLVNPEAALVFGPLSLQGEYFRPFVKSDTLDNPQFSGYYAYASYFITGEHRRYDPKAGVFTRVIPSHTFNLKEGGWGAFEVGVRYSNLDLTDGVIAGGEEDNITFGINWYLNPNVRAMFNYIHANVGDRRTIQTVTDGNADIMATRFQINF